MVKFVYHNEYPPPFNAIMIKAYCDNNRIQGRFLVADKRLDPNDFE